MKQSIDKTEHRKVYETPRTRVVELETHGRLLQASMIPVIPDPAFPD